MQDDTLEPQPGTRLAVVVDDRGALVDRHALVMAEKTLLCEVRCSHLLLGLLHGFLWRVEQDVYRCDLSCELPTCLVS
jgi:hypothetical protein